MGTKKFGQPPFLDAEFRGDLFDDVALKRHKPVLFSQNGGSSSDAVSIRTYGPSCRWPGRITGLDEFEIFQADLVPNFELLFSLVSLRQVLKISAPRAISFCALCNRTHAYSRHSRSCPFGDIRAKAEKTVNFTHGFAPCCAYYLTRERRSAALPKIAGIPCEDRRCRIAGVCRRHQRRIGRMRADRSLPTAQRPQHQQHPSQRCAR